MALNMKPILYFERFRNIFRDNKRIIILLAVATLVLFTAFRIDAHIQEKQELQNQIETRETELQTLSEELQELESEVVDKETSLEEKARQEAEMKREIEKLRKELQAKKERESRIALATPVQAQAPVGSGSCEAEIAKYDWNQKWALEVLYRESGGRPDAHNFSHVTKDDSWGCFQINLYPPNNLYRPPSSELVVASKNVALAYEWYVRDGRTFCGQWPNTC